MLAKEAQSDSSDHICIAGCFAQDPSDCFLWMGKAYINENNTTLAYHNTLFLVVSGTMPPRLALGKHSSNTKRMKQTDYERRVFSNLKSLMRFFKRPEAVAFSRENAKKTFKQLHNASSRTSFFQIDTQCAKMYFSYLYLRALAVLSSHQPTFSCLKNQLPGATHIFHTEKSTLDQEEKNNLPHPAFSG